MSIDPTVFRIEDLPMPTAADFIAGGEREQFADGTAEQYARRQSARAEENRRVAAASLKAIPSRYRDASVTHPQIRTWVEQVVRASFRPSVNDELEYHEWAGPSLLLTGNVGAGKTYQAYGAIRALAVSGLRMPNFTATTAPDMYGAVRPRSGVDSEDEFRRFAHARVLLLDDLGVRPQGTEWTHELDYRLVNYRYDRELPTIFTTNVLGDSLEQAMSERVLSRMIEMVTEVPITGADRRRGGGA